MKGVTSEVFAKVRCHNLVVVVHEMHELGIAPAFDPTPAPSIIRFPGA